MSLADLRERTAAMLPLIDLPDLLQKVICCASAVASDNGPGWDVSPQLGRRFPACASRPDMTGCLGFAADG